MKEGINEVKVTLLLGKRLEDIDEDMTDRIDGSQPHH